MRPINFFSKYLLKKSLMENFIFCTVLGNEFPKFLIESEIGVACEQQTPGAII